MSARLVRVCLDAERLEALLEALDEEGLLLRYLGSKDTGFCVEALVPPEKVDRVLYKVRHLAGEGDLAVMLRPQWSLPELAPAEEERPVLQELEATLAAGAGVGPGYLLALLGSALLAYFGLVRNDAALLIASMITAPLLLPAAALAWAAMRRDGRLFIRSGGALLSGILLSLLVGFLLGRWLPFTPGPLLLARTDPNLADLALALVAGAIGVVALLGGFSASLVGVMVALALLPPLVGAGALFALQEPARALGALLLFWANLASMMLAYSVGFALAFRWRISKVLPAVALWLGLLLLFWLSRPPA